MSKHVLVFASMTLVTSFFLSAVGCDKPGHVRYEVSGEVAVAGQPLPEGKLIFIPDRSAGNDGPQGLMSVHDGQFSTASDPAGKGVGAGAYRLEIQGFDGVPYQGPEGKVPEGNMLFPPFFEKVTLPEGDSTIMIDITPSPAGAQATIEIQPQ